jgi:hypothetical protein
MLPLPTKERIPSHPAPAIGSYLAERIEVHADLGAAVAGVSQRSVLRYAREGYAEALRVAIVNHRSWPEDFDARLEAVVRIGGELAGAPPVPVSSESFTETAVAPPAGATESGGSITTINKPRVGLILASIPLEPRHGG